MNPLIHFLGICIKFIILNTKIFVKYLFIRNKEINSSNIDTVVFTHNLGGGTESYVRKNFYRNNILIVRLCSYRNDSFFMLEHEKEVRILYSKKMFLFLNNLPVSTIIINSLNAYNKPEKIINYVISKKKQCSIGYLVHDFHAVCPTGMFVISKKFCQYKCENCKISNTKINDWRNMWKKFLQITDYVICFSNSSKEILCQFYACIEDRVKIIPHSMTYCDFSPINMNEKFKNIAVIGNCSNIPKGKEVIKNLVLTIKKLKERKLYIIGKYPFFFHKNSNFVKYTGEYAIRELPHLIKTYNVRVIVFTSICPETFSYAISEFMRLDLYIVSLDLGAQGEKLKNYDKAIFIPDLEPSSILAGVERCFI